MQGFHKNIIGIVLICMLLIPCAQVFAQDGRYIFWVASHRLGGIEYGDGVKSGAVTRLMMLRDEIEFGTRLREYVDRHNVRDRFEILFQPDILRSFYNTDTNRALAIMAGTGAPRPENIGTLLYIGPPDDIFDVESAEVHLLGVERYSSADMYVRLLYIYAIAKQCHHQALDFKTYISPLKEYALNLIEGARSVDERIVGRIERTFRALGPTP